MAKPRSDDKQKAILAAAIRVIAAQGLAAPTATIAKEAGVSNGSLFTYFETKAHLLNQLYVDLKVELAEASLAGLPTGSDIRSQLFYVWSHWIDWAVSWPEKRRALVHLLVSDDITPQSHQAASDALAGTRQLLERSRENGPMQDAPLDLIATLMNGLTEATLDYITHDPKNADTHCKAAFDALWRMIA